MRSAVDYYKPMHAKAAWEMIATEFKIGSIRYSDLERQRIERIVVGGQRGVSDPDFMDEDSVQTLISHWRVLERRREAQENETRVAQTTYVFYCLLVLLVVVVFLFISEWLYVQAK